MEGDLNSPVSLLRDGIKIDELQSGVTFEVDVADRDNSEEIGADEAFDDYFGEEETVGQFYYGLNPADAKRHHAHWTSKTFKELEAIMKPLMADKGVLKHEVKSGYGPLVLPKAMVTIHYSTFLEKESMPYDSTRLRNQPLNFVLGDHRVLPGIDVAVATMHKGEISEFLVKPEYAFGAMGCAPRIPANSSLFYIIEMVCFIDSAAAVEFNEMSAEDRIKAPFEKTLSVCMAEHEAGNQMFAKKQYSQAVSRFRKAILMLEKLNFADENQEKICFKVLLKLYLNASQCNLYLNQPERAVHNAKRALEIEANNIKGLFRCGKALRVLGQYQAARKYLLRANRLSPNNDEIVQQLSELDKKEKKMKDNEVGFCQRMFKDYSSGGPRAKKDGDEKENDHPKEIKTGGNELEGIDKNETVGSDPEANKNGGGDATLDNIEGNDVKIGRNDDKDVKIEGGNVEGIKTGQNDLEGNKMGGNDAKIGGKAAKIGENDPKGIKIGGNDLKDAIIGGNKSGENDVKGVPKGNENEGIDSNGNKIVGNSMNAASGAAAKKDISEKPIFDLKPELQEEVAKILREFDEDEIVLKVSFSVAFSATEIAFASQLATEMGFDCEYPKLDTRDAKLIVKKKKK